MQFGLLGVVLFGENGLWAIGLALAAYGLDLLLADPRALPHPVQAVGRLLRALEPLLRGSVGVKGPAALRRAGCAGLVLCLAVIGGLVFVLTSLPFIGWLVCAYFAWAGLALGGLRRAGMETLTVVEQGSLDAARRAVGMLVSRDTTCMEQDELRRALAETLAENFNDGFVAPFFWLLLTGPVGLWLYKAASTMDSMWGYKTPQWLDFGRCAARLDDVLAFIPARLSAWFLCLAGRRMPGSEPCPPWATLRTEARRLESPNAGWPMTVCAWLCGARMGGPTPYHGSMVEKPLLGPEGSWTAPRMETLLDLIGRGGSVALFCLCFTAWLLLLIF